MKEIIVKHIEELEKVQGISILLAVESGSRAWGCPSPDSDFDVRMIYKRTISEYLEIDEKPDTINYFHGKLLDINGWDIKKAFKLIRKSNATPFEWAQSPIIYKEKEAFSEILLNLSREYFQPRHSVNHYKGIAKNSYSNIDLGDTIQLKKLFYVLRPLMAAKWIIEKNEIPPMDIPQLINIVNNQEIVSHIKELLIIKNEVNEDYSHQMESKLSGFIKNEFDFIDSVNLPHLDKKINSKKLNQAFKNLIEQ